MTAVSPLGLLSVEAHKILSAATAFRLSEARPREKGKNVCSGDLSPYADCQRLSVANGAIDDGSHCVLVS